MGLRPVAWIVAAATVASCGTCEPKPPPPEAGAEAARSPFASVTAPPPPRPVPKRPDAPCRAATVEGRIAFVPLVLTDAGVSQLDAGISAMGPVPSDQWLDLAAGARLVARDPNSTRETSFTGPARALACVDFDEESWLVRGTFDSVPGAGERPGGEEWVVTR